MSDQHREGIEDALRHYGDVCAEAARSHLVKPDMSEAITSILAYVDLEVQAARDEGYRDGQEAGYRQFH